MKEEENNISDSQSLTYLEPVETATSNSLPKNFIINCDSIYLNQKSIDLEIQIPTEKIEAFDCLIINGIKFKKDKSE